MRLLALNKNLKGRPDLYMTVGYILMMGLLAYATFGSLAKYGFVFEDQVVVQGAEIVLTNPLYIFWTEDWPDHLPNFPGRPTVSLTLAFGRMLLGENPAGYHLLLVGLHLMASLLLAYTACRLGMDLTLSLIGGLFFLLHVGHYSAIQWISCMAYPMAVCFGLGTLLCLNRVLRQGSMKWLFGSFVLLTLGMGAHASVVGIPLIGIYHGWSMKYPRGRIIWVGIPLFLVSVGLAALLLWIYPETDQARGWGLKSGTDWHAFENGVDLLARLIVWAFFLREPMLEGYDPVPVWHMGLGAFVGFGLLYLVLRRSHQPVALWALWTLLTLAPFIPRSFAVSRYLYPASAGSSMVLSWMIVNIITLCGKNWKPTIRHATLGTTITLLSLSCISDLKKSEVYALYFSSPMFVLNPDYQPDEKKESQWLVRVLTHPGHVLLSGRDLEKIVLRLADNGLPIPEEDLQKLTHAYSHTPQIPLLLTSLSAYVQGDLDMHQEAEADLWEVFEHLSEKHKNPYRGLVAAAYNNVSASIVERRQYDRAIQIYLKALHWQPVYVTALFNLGNLCRQLGDFERARVLFEQVLLIQPDHELSQKGLAEVTQQMK
ncbi:MAG: tetratricopeptide repeat protein [bacterium]|nr:tetratricopeptide repeat protein [bacterium]